MGVWWTVGLQGLLLPLVLSGSSLLDAASFRFAEDLQARQCRRAPGDGAEPVEFCILGRPGSRRGLMPAVFRIGADGARREIWRDRDRGFSPWKLELVELDGDPGPEIALGVYKHTRHDPSPANRLFIYDWTGSSLAPRWLGSQLALPWDDFQFIRRPAGNTDRLVTLETAPGGKLIREYRWNGFGFTGVQILFDSRTADRGQDPVAVFQKLGTRRQP